MRKFLAAVALLASLPVVGHAATFDTFVGYADNLRASPFFPSPFFGDSSVDFYAGQDPGAFQLDAGAVMIRNTSGAAITVNDLTVTLNPTAGPIVFHLWSGLIGAGQSIDPGQVAIFTQTTQFDFDTSDFGIINGLNANDPTNNCSTGAFSTTAACLQNAPQVDITIDGILTSLSDTGHVLDTGGFDSVNSNPCVGGNNPAGGNLPGGCNESLQWRLIGTTGIENPGGTVPEPMTIALFGVGLAGLGVLRRRRAA